MQVSMKVLISTIHPTAGGVPSMLKFIIDCLQQRNYQVTLAYYRPYSLSPELSVPLHELLFRKPSTINEQYLDVDCIGLGCWLPELEVSHYWSTKAWRQIIASHDAHLTVSGSCMAASVYTQNQIPFMGWIASDWQGDRLQRVNRFPWFRKLVDRYLITPMAKNIETKIVNTNQLIALSDHTREELNSLVGRNAVNHVLSMPIDTEHFFFKSTPELTNQIGFVGRFEDPRKQIDLLLTSFAKVVDRLPNLQLILVGDTISQKTKNVIQELKITNNVTSFAYLTRDDLVGVLHNLDMFVLPSHQEGLCIAALEAMSCGVPVISTRCGGPESYLVDGVNGELCEQNSDTIAAKVLKLYSNENLRVRYSKAARETVIQSFSEQSQINKFWQLFDVYLQSKKTVKMT